MRSQLQIPHCRRDRLRVRRSLLLIGCVLLLVTNGLPQTFKDGKLSAPEIPKAATIEIILLTAPGIDAEGSRWEIAYEFRIINEAAYEAAYFEARKQGKSEGIGRRVGELIREADVKQLLRPAENHKFVLQIPFSPEIQERLKNQPRDRVKVPPGLETREANKSSQEQESKFQTFMFYSVINIYDARLRKNILIQVPQTWDFANYLDARFGFKIEINNDGSYSWKTSSPAKIRAPVLEIRNP